MKLSNFKKFTFSKFFNKFTNDKKDSRARKSIKFNSPNSM